MDRDAAASAEWRQALIEWTRAIDVSPLAAPRLSLPVAPPIAALLERLGLPSGLAPAVQLLYGAHLLGHHGVAAAEVASVLGELGEADRWREALAAGALGGVGLVALRRSRLRLCGAARRLLDQRPAKYGPLVGPGKGAPPQRSAALFFDPVEGAGDDPLDFSSLSPLQLAEAASATVDSPVLAVDRPLSTVEELRAAALEARLRGAIAAVPYPWLQRLPADAPALYLAPSREEAEATGFAIRSLRC